MVVRQHDLIAIQLRTVAAGQAPQLRLHGSARPLPALDASRRRSYPRPARVITDTDLAAVDPLNVSTFER